MYNLVHQKIQKSKNIFITSHHSCPDAIGSICALTEFLHNQQKSVFPFLSRPVPKHLLNLPCSQEIQTEKSDLSLFDLFLILDAGDLKQTGLEKELSAVIKNAANKSVINIDHHKTNEYFGHINVVDKNASSTCEMIYLMLNNNGLNINEKISECLLTGIIGDTGNFTNGATNKQAFSAAADLIWRGANIFKIIENLFSTEASINTLRLWGKIFERLTYNPKYDIAVSYVLQKDLLECQVSEDCVEIVANLLNYIHNIKAGMLLKEKEDGSFKVSMRSTHPNIDVSRLAKMLGGGGHKKAAGFGVKKFNFRVG
ncbi:MAG: DHH family phosphoesterase [Candidatus Jacksonbacteria bacterium]